MSAIIDDTARADTRALTQAGQRDASQTRAAPKWPRYGGETYYNLPAVKPAPFDWRVNIYLLVSGIAGAAQILAAVAERHGGARMASVVRNGRYLALGGSVAGAALLIGDLKTPDRWYNMLRIFKSTSAMSIGSYILAAFGALSGLTTLAHRTRKGGALSKIGKHSQWPAAVAGAGMMTYTGALLSSTSTPLWSSESTVLGARLAASSMAAGAAMLSLAEHCAGRAQNARALGSVAITATAAYAVLSACADRSHSAARVVAPLRNCPYGPMYRLGSALSITVPIVCHGLDVLTARRSRLLSMAAAVSMLVGAAATRYAYVEAGKVSAQRPEEYLRYTELETPHDAEKTSL